MKNKKYSKILVAVLSLALLIGAVIGISASAENAVNVPEILGKNIQYGADLKFMVAIDPASVGGEGKTVTLSVYEGDPAEGGKLIGQPTKADYENTTETNLGVDYAYVATSTYGISALAYNENYYLVVECDAAKTVAQYSAIEYFLERLYADDVINKTDAESLVQKELYQSAIAYGSAAQKMAAFENKYTGANVADYLYVMAKDGKVNGADGAIVLKGDALNFTYTGAEDASGLAYWLDPNGNKAATATVNGIYTAKFADYHFNDLSNNTVISPKTSGNLSLVDNWSDGDKDVSKYKNFLYNNNNASFSGTSSFAIVDGKLKYTSSGATDFGFKNAVEGNHTVFETDMTITVPEGKTGVTLTVKYKNNSGADVFKGHLFYTVETGALKFRIQTAYGNIGEFPVYVADGGSLSASFNLKIESYSISETNDTTMVIYVNGAPIWILDSRGADKTNGRTGSTDLYKNTDNVYVSEYGFQVQSGTKIPVAGVVNYITLNPNSNSPCEMTFDNIIFTTDSAVAPTYNTTPKS